MDMLLHFSFPCSLLRRLGTPKPKHRAEEKQGNELHSVVHNICQIVDLLKLVVVNIKHHDRHRQESGAEKIESKGQRMSGKHLGVKCIQSIAQLEEPPDANDA